MMWLLMALLLQATLPQGSSKGSVEGIVVRMGTNEPIEGVRVLLLPDRDQHKSSPGTTTKDGKFAFQNLAAGTYRLAFASNGYVRQEYGQRVLNGVGTPVALTAGQAIRGLVVQLTPTGTVSGRVQDNDGNPLPHVAVGLVRSGYNEDGRKILRSFGTAFTNDLGEYRIYFVTPGRYDVMAGTIPGLQGEELFSGTGDAIRQAFNTAFFPTPVDVQPGTERRGADLVLQKQSRWRIRGRVVDSSSGKAPEKVSVRLVYRNAATGVDNWGESPNPYYQNGAFEFRNVVPGSYTLSAFFEESGQPQRDDRIRIYRVGSAPLDVYSDMDGVVVTLNPTSSISGRVLGPDGQPAPLWFWNISTGGPPQGAQLRPAGERPAPVLGPQFSGLQPDGTFRVFNLTPGEYLLSMDWLSDQYIKEARFGGIDVLKQPLHFTGSENGVLEIAVSPNMGAIEGRVVNERLEAVSAAQVALVPNQNRERVKLFRGVTTDANGRFSISKIAPGDYKLFAWEGLDPFGYFDPELLRRSEPKSFSVQVGELSSQSVTLTAIPAP